VVAGITFEGVYYDSRRHRLVVVDQAGGPGSRYRNAAQAAASRQGLAAINGGFFTPEGRPLGLLMTNGRAVGSWNQASSLGSGIYHITSGSAQLTRRDRLSPKAAGLAEELLQAGPMLVWDGQAVAGLNNDKRAERTLLVWDGGHRWWLGRSSACTLQQLARALVGHGLSGGPTRHALNLDGGSSSELWISDRVSGGPHRSSHWFLKPARNYLVLLPATTSIEP